MTLTATERTWQQRLLDLYGGMLTEHQQEGCRLYLDEDWSYAELGEHFGCTRSAAHDLVHRASTQLEEFEQRLGHLKIFEDLNAQVAALGGQRV